MYSASAGTVIRIIATYLELALFIKLAKNYSKDIMKGWLNKLIKVRCTKGLSPYMMGLN